MLASLYSLSAAANVQPHDSFRQIHFRQRNESRRLQVAPPPRLAAQERASRSEPGLPAPASALPTSNLGWRVGGRNFSSASHRSLTIEPRSWGARLPGVPADLNEFMLPVAGHAWHKPDHGGSPS
jgi:hypothetical protein